MDPQILLGLFVLAPFFAVIWFHSSGVFTFLTLCLGSVLATYVAGDANTVLSSARSGAGLATMQWVQLTLLLLPMIASIILTRKKTKGTKLILSATLALLAGGLLALLAVPYLSRSLQDQIIATELWHQLDSLQTAMLLGATGLILFNLFSTRWKPDPEKKKHKKH